MARRWEERTAADALIAKVKVQDPKAGTPAAAKRGIEHLIISCPFCWRPVWPSGVRRLRTSTNPIGDPVLGYIKITRAEGLVRRHKRGPLVHSLAHARPKFGTAVDRVPDLGRRALERMLATGLLSVADARAVLARFDPPRSSQAVPVTREPPRPARTGGFWVRVTDENGRIRYERKGFSGEMAARLHLRQWAENKESQGYRAKLEVFDGASNVVCRYNRKLVTYTFEKVSRTP